MDVFWSRRGPLEYFGFSFTQCDFIEVLNLGLCPHLPVSNMCT